MVQLHFINWLIQKFEKETIGKRIYRTTGTPRFKIQRPTKDMEVLDIDQQKKYHSGIEMLLFLHFQALKWSILLSQKLQKRSN
jgi:hypothetical protein